MKTVRPATPALIGGTLAVLLGVGVAAWALLAPQRRPPASTGVVAPSPDTAAANARATAPTPPGVIDQLVQSTPDRDLHRPRRIISPGRDRLVAFEAEPAKPRSRSPLERSPGYYPPDDPESMSVVTGRRDAPLVDLELTGGAASIDDLGRMLVAGLNARDEAAIHALGVTRREFEVILWREFPESRPVTHITADDAWEMASAKTHAGVSRAVGSFGNRGLEFIRVDSGPPDPFRNFSLYRHAEIVAKDPATASEVRLRFAPSFVERHGRYKVLAFKD